MSIVIEKAMPPDAKALLDYLKQVGGKTENLTFGAEGLPVDQEAEARYLAQMKSSKDDVMLLAKENGKIIGTASLNRLPRRMSHRGDFSISVLKEYWNQGIGSRLLEQILVFAREHHFTILDLQVRSDNAAAIHLYEKYGFQKVGTHPAFFMVGQKEISFDYMVLRI